MKKSISLFYLILFCACCSSQVHNFSYSSKLYSTQKNIKEDMKAHGEYISYKPYLFEFNIGLNQIDSINEKTNNRSTFFSYDTISVYLIDPNKKMVFEFDSFKVNSNIISKGQFEDKKTGVHIVENNTIKDSTILKGNALKDTLIWGKKLLYYSNVQKNSKNADSVIVTIFFINDSNFISIHDIPNRLIKDELYNMVGFKIHRVETNESVSEELEEVKKLSSSDEKICADMISRMHASTKPK